MRIAKDLDGTTAATEVHMLEFHNARYGTNLRREDIYDLQDIWRIWGGTLQDMFRKFEEFYHSQYFDQIKPVDGAVEAAEELSKYVQFTVTARPAFMLPKTYLFHDQYFKKTHSGLYLANYEANLPKSRVLAETKADYIIEDTLQFAEDCAHYCPVFLLDTPWNQGPLKPNITRVKSWKEIVRILK